MLTVYTRLMWLYPPSFRARFGDEMLQLVRDEATHGRRVPWLRTFADLFGSATDQRWRERNMKAKWWIVPIGALMALFVARIVVGSGFTPQMFIVLLVEVGIVAAIYGAAALLGRRVRGAEYDYAKRQFRWWWTVAGLAGAAEAVMVIAQLIQEPKGTNVFAMFLICGFASLVFTGMATRNRRAGNYMIAAGVVPLMALFWLVVPAVVALFVIVNALADNVRMARTGPAVV